MLLTKSNYTSLDDIHELESLMHDRIEAIHSHDSFEQAGLKVYHTQASQDRYTTEIPLYKDSFIIIYPATVVLLSYYFPFGKPKTIQMRDILSVTTPEALKIQWWNYMNWGRGFNRIWWAKDDKRGTDEPNQVLIFSEKGETLLKACSVENRKLAMDIIKERMALV